jgi:hypothetical protein
MITFQNRQTQLDDLLDKMAEAIELDTTRKRRMETAYNAVKDWIQSDPGFFSKIPLEVYVQGSVKVGTSTRPLRGEEFDLDIVIHLRVDYNRYSPLTIYNELKRRLSEHAGYKEMMELKNRCIRLNYAGDFHMDILPACQELTFDVNKLKVPDRELGGWASSNPRGYAEWFLGKANLVVHSLLEKAYAQEKLPTDEFRNKKPLQRAVMLVKKYRDEYFQKDDTYATSSIILTTICGQMYQSEDSIFDTIDHIIVRIRENAKILGNQRIKVLNPVNSDEDFTDKWSNRIYYDAFLRFCDHLYNTWQEMKMNKGAIYEDRLLKGLFGEDTYTRGVTLQSESLNQARTSGKLAMNRATGILTSISSSGLLTSVRGNTFYGDK